MPRDGRKGRKRRGLLSSSDISLQDFADCPCPQACNRLKKSVVGAKAEGVVPKASGQRLLEDKEMEELTWFEKDLDAFVIDDPVGEEEEDNAIAPDDKSAKRNKKSGKKDGSKANGLIYPLDLWCHLSNFIRLEDVQNFASICRGSYTVTETATFWRKLYERFYLKREDPSQSLPSHLRPTGMERLHGLRSRVIRAMYHLYPPFASRVQSRGPLDDEPHDLKGHRCLLAWHQPGVSKGWQFCFKFQRPSISALTHRAPNKQDLYYGYNDLFFNSENGCCVLKVTCCHFASVPPVMGLLLKQVFMTLSTGFRHHRLRLHFDSSVMTRDAVSDTVVTLDDIMAVKVMNWWHPQYPFQP